LEAARAVALENRLTWANEIAKPDGSRTDIFSGGSNQLSSDSGFTFTVNTTGAQDGFNAMIGINAMFYFTKENLGEEGFNRMASGLEGLDVFEYSPDQKWVMPDASCLSDLGIGVHFRYPDGSARDITSLMSFGLNIAEIDDGKILLSYGAVIVDRALTENEGQALLLSEEEEVLLSDGVLDDVITGTWWISKANADGGGGCSTGTALPAISVIAIIALAVLKQGKLFV
jgi:hypothetical protein